jgi:hypothetical protein
MLGLQPCTIHMCVLYSRRALASTDNAARQGCQSLGIRAFIAMRMGDVQVLAHIVNAAAAGTDTSNASAATAARSVTERFGWLAPMLGELQAAAATRTPLWPAGVVTLAQMQAAATASAPAFPVLRRFVRRLVDCLSVDSELRTKWVRALNRSTAACRELSQFCRCPMHRAPGCCLARR